MLLDAHIHLQDISGQGTLKTILMSARQNGVGRFFCNATSTLDWDTVQGIAVSSANIVPFFGTHPWYADTVDALLESALTDRIVRFHAGVGEIGLDNSVRDVSADRQKHIFHRQLDIALMLKRPFVIHCVNAWSELLHALRSRRVQAGRFMVHSFNGPEDALEALLELGAYISFSPRLLASEKLRRAFFLVPLDRVLLETDYPYVWGSHRGTMGNPADYFAELKKLYTRAAVLKCVNAADFEAAIWENGTAFSE